MKLSRLFISITAIGLLITPPAFTAENIPSQSVVQRAVDGDTLKLANGDRVRLIGIDTPESSSNPKLYRDAKKSKQDVKSILAQGAKAKEFTKKLVEGKKIYLEYDVQKRDKYGRLLAYVFLLDPADKTIPEDNLDYKGLSNFNPDGKGNRKGALVFVNSTIVKAGYGQVYTIPPDIKYQNTFLEMQKNARENKRGLWNQ